MIFTIWWYWDSWVDPMAGCSVPLSCIRLVWCHGFLLRSAGLIRTPCLIHMIRKVRLLRIYLCLRIVRRSLVQQSISIAHHSFHGGWFIPRDNMRWFYLWQCLSIPDLSGAICWSDWSEAHQAPQTENFPGFDFGCQPIELVVLLTLGHSILYHSLLVVLA